MDDDWDDGVVFAQSAPPTSFASEGGTKFAAGRGFKPVGMGSDDTWNNAAPVGAWNDSDAPSDFGNGGRGGRGRGGRGRGGRDRDGGGRDRNGGGRDRDGGGRDRNGGGRDRDGGDRDRNGGGRDHDGGGRDRYGGRDRDGDRNRDGGDSWSNHRNDDKKEENGEPQKPREIYIPVERLNDDNLFTETISSGVNFIKLDDIDVKVTGEDVPTPILSFDKSGLRPHLLDNVKKSGYLQPTPIQKHAIPILLAGRDMMACAQTGSGKTAAFLLPIINMLLQSQKPPDTEGETCKPNVVIVSPTRELTIQIYDQARKFASNSIVKAEVIYGGTSVHHQRSKIMRGCHILVATPGRLNDFVNHGHISFASVQFIVLDEADRMLDMGFLPIVESMLGHSTMVATGDRQTLMFSATFPEEVQHLAGKFLHNYIFVAVGVVGSASTDVEQVFYEVSRFDKRNKLMEMLSAAPGEKTVVFVETKRSADFLATFLSENSIQSTSIHGDRLQREREAALWDFKKGIRSILVATGVAARGLDIEGIQHVINYDLPKSVDEYVHRIGRTGRVGNRGKATSFFDGKCDSAVAGPLATILKQAGQEVPEFLLGGGFGGGHENGNFGGRDIRGENFGQGQNFNQVPVENEDEDW